MQPYLFGAILNRDETFSLIVNHGMRLKQEWAKEPHAELQREEEEESGSENEKEKGEGDKDGREDKQQPEEQKEPDVTQDNFS